MLGKRDAQGALFRPDHVLREHVGRESFHGWLAEVGPRLFRDGDFEGLYGSRGRPSVPPSQLCLALLLQAHDGVSDDEAIGRSAYDIRWKVVLGLELDEKLCAKSTLQLFRAKLIMHESYREVFEASVSACRAAGLGRRKSLEVAIDTTPVFGRGAVKDTFNLVSDGIRSVLGEVSRLKGRPLTELAASRGLWRHVASSFKGSVEIDWSDETARRALVGELVAEARTALSLGGEALRGHAKSSEKARGLREARSLLAELVLQDIEEEPEDGQGPVMRRGTSKDRIVSTTDPEMRHGHKSHAKGFDGYKASIVVETTDGVILATGVEPANRADREGAVALVEQAGKGAERPVRAVLGDTAYGDSDTRKALAARAVEVVAKAPPPPARKGCFSHHDFTLDARRGVLRCPAGKRSIRRDRVGKDGFKYVFSRRDCTPCPLRSRCTTSAVWPRMVTITERTKQLDRHRKEQKTPRFRRRYRQRVIVEHRFGRLGQLGIRQARYLGRAKTAFQIALAATVANLTLAAAAAGPARLDQRVRAGLQALTTLGRTFIQLVGTVVTLFDRIRRTPATGVSIA